MKRTVCNSATDSHGKELVRHGSLQFPIACYADELERQSVPWHWHEEMEFAFVTAGKVTFLLENARLELGPGDGIFVNARALHGVEQTREPDVQFFSAVFHPRLVGGSMESVFWQKLIQPLLQDRAFPYLHLKQEVPWQRQVLDCFRAVWHAAAEESWDYENKVRYELSRALAMIHQQEMTETSRLSCQDGVNSARIRTMLEFIEQHYTHDITVEDIASSASVSASVCLRCFKEMLGVTPIQYVKQLRLGKASELLRETTIPVKDIALSCGFGDVSYFTKTFREKHGCTPSGYRKKQQDGEGF